MIDPSTIPARGPDIRSLIVERSIDADAMSVWADWASADGVTRWWPVPSAEIDLRIGGPFELHFSLDEPEGLRGSEGCRYLAYVPGEMISFTWNAPPHLPLRSSNTWVVITFTPTSARSTRVRLVHTGFLVGADWDDYMAYFERAWASVLDLEQASHATD